MVDILNNSIFTVAGGKCTREEEIEYYENWVDEVMEEEGIELEKCAGNKKRIGEINGNEIYVYQISLKYINKKSAEIYIYIGGNRKNNYRISFEYNIGEMKTGDYLEEHINRVEHTIMYYNNILIQDKETKLWKNMGNKNNEFKKELKKIKNSIIFEYLNPQINLLNKQ